MEMVKRLERGEAILTDRGSEFVCAEDMGNWVVMYSIVILWLLARSPM